MSEEWSDWIIHGGGPRPVPKGTFCHLVYADGTEFIGPVGIGAHGFAVDRPRVRWGGRWCPVIRYRVKRPRGMAVLDRVMADPMCEGVG